MYAYSVQQAHVREELREDQLQIKTYTQLLAPTDMFFFIFTLQGKTTSVSTMEPRHEISTLTCHSLPGIFYLQILKFTKLI